MRAIWNLGALVVMSWALCSGSVSAADVLRAGMGEADITPDVTGKAPVWIAGYGQNRRAEGVHDPLHVRVVVLEHGDERLALVSADVVGLQHPSVEAIRAKLSGFRYVMVSSTHNHEGPDTMGLWGPNPFRSGIDPAYTQLLQDRIAEAARLATENLAPVQASYGAAEDETLLRDSRLPLVYDGHLRVLRFNRVSDGQLHFVLMQWNCHPEAMGGSNKFITADFPGTTVTELKSRYGCPVAYFTGTVGGLMAPPRGLYKNEAGEELREGDFEYSRVYGAAVAKLAEKAIDGAQPLSLVPFTVSAKTISVPLSNPVYQVARAAGVLKREGFAWTGNFEEIGEPYSKKNKDKLPAARTEVAYLRLGDLHIACIPGEIYPELVYGKYAEPVEANVDFPDAPLETPVMTLLPGEKNMLFGLANDELGYILPKRQWDSKPPFAYGRSEGQYGEENSVGPEVGPILLEALENRIREADKSANATTGS